MNHKRTLVLMAASLVLCAGLTASVAAQSGAATVSPNQNPQGEAKGERRGEGRGERRMGRPELNLTEDQKAQLRSMRQSQRDQVMSIRNDKNLSDEQRMAKMRAIREGSRQQVLGILTPQQQEQIKDARSEGRGRGQRLGQDRGGERGMGHGANREMGLTEEQRTRLKAIQQTTRDQVNAIRNDSTLSQEQRIAKLQSIHQNTRQQMSGILTAEQQEKMKEGRRGGPRGAGHFRGRRGGGFGPGLRRPADTTPTGTPAKP